jgi:hypothetical protein
MSSAGSGIFLVTSRLLSKIPRPCPANNVARSGSLAGEYATGSISPRRASPIPAGSSGGAAHQTGMSVCAGRPPPDGKAATLTRNSPRLRFAKPTRWSVSMARPFPRIHEPVSSVSRSRTGSPERDGGRPTPIRVRSNVDDYPDRYIEQQDARGQLDWWLQAQLKGALEDVLQPHLAAWVAELWEVPDLPEPRLVLHHFARSPSRRHTQEAARRYRIELMTINSKGEETRAPWRKAHVDELKTTIRRWIDAAKADVSTVNVGTSRSETSTS